MTPDQKTKFEQWLSARDIRPECIACGAVAWTPGDIIAGVVQNDGNMTIGGPSVPMAQLVCGNCAAILLFAAVPIGLLT